MNPSKRQERRTEEAETVNLSGEDQGKESTDDGKTEHVCYETKIIGGVVVRTPVTKVSKKLKCYWIHIFVVSYKIVVLHLQWGGESVNAVKFDIQNRSGQIT